MMESTCLYSYRFGQFELQPGERRWLAAGVPVAVEPRAFDVLVALVERAGHLVTKEELFRLVWPKLIVEENNLQVQVSALRKILGPAAIVTVPGQGYRLVLATTREASDVAPLGTAVQNVRSAQADTTSPIQAFRQVFAPATDVREDAARHPLAHLRRWKWIAGGVAIVLIAAAAWLYQLPRTTLSKAAIAEPPALSIAILPFTAPADEQLAAALMPEIHAAFWRNARSARMAAPELVAAYRGKRLDARAIGHELNVRYVAEGEIRRAGDMRLLSARLIDATNGAQIWSERFEVPVEERPASHDALATRVARHIWFSLYGAEKHRLLHQSSPDLTATDIWLRAAAMDYEPLESARAARKYLLKALELDPYLVGAMLSLAFTYEPELDFDPHVDGDRIRKDFEELSLRAIATDRNDPSAWQLRTMGLAYNNRLEAALAAIAEWERIEPNDANARGWAGVVLIAQGRSEEALTEPDHGLAIDPTGPNIGFLVRQKCKAYSYLGQYKKAIGTCEKATTDHLYLYPFIHLTVAYAQLGEMDKAASAKTQLLKLNPGFTIARLGYGMSLQQNPAWLRQAETYVIPGLRKAGIPEK